MNLESIRLRVNEFKSQQANPQIFRADFSAALIINHWPIWNTNLPSWNLNKNATNFCQFLTEHTFIKDGQIFQAGSISDAEAVFLVVCDPPMNEL